MARSKNATALFEVIHTAKKPPKPSPTGGAIPAPKWWAKGSKGAERPSAATHAPADADDAEDDAPHPEPSGGTRRSWLAAARQSAGHPEPRVEEPAHEPADAGPSPVYITHIYPPDAADRESAEESDAPVPDQQHRDQQHRDQQDSAEPVETPAVFKPPVEPPAERPSWGERRAKVLADRAPSADPTFDPTADVAPADLRGPRVRKWGTPDAAEHQEERPPAPRPQKVRRSAGPTPSAHKATDLGAAVAVDREAGEVRFRLSFGGAIAAGAILLIVIVIAFLAGRQRPVSESLADPSGAVRAAGDTTVHGTAADPSTDLMAAASTAGPAGVPNPAAPTAVVSPQPSALTASATLPPEPTAVPAEPAPRQVGMMYVVIQSYPDRETAVRAGEFLNRNDVACTVIPGLSGFALRDWYSIVGLQPFARGDHRPAVQEYLRHVTALGPKFSAKVYNQFQPQMYTWRADSGAPRP